MVKNPQYSFKISDHLDLVNTLKIFSNKNTWTYYDVEADVLYINFHQPALIADDSELTEDGILIRYQNDEIIGLTVLTRIPQVDSRNGIIHLYYMD
jgi:uncharacterized protein YuzE